MIQLKLTLKSNRPSTIYASNGKAYKLQPGSNTLNLEYDDYLALAKTLLIKPVAPKPVDEKSTQKPVDEHKEDAQIAKDEKVEDTSKPVESKTDEGKDSVDEDNTETHKSPVDENKEQTEDTSETIESETEEHIEESIEEPINDEAVDYSTWSYTELKAKYKEVTGKSCKLKKDEIIAFLQEQSNNAE